MRDKAVILFSNNTSIEKRLHNPSGKFKLRYKINGEAQDFYYIYDRNKSYINKSGLFRKRLIFYEHDKMNPLDPQFKTNENSTKIISEIISTGLFKKLGDSTKNMFQQNITTIVLGVCGIAGLVAIILFK